MRHLKWTLTAVIVLMIPACNAVFIEQPIGENPLVATAEDWEGTWVNGEGAGRIEVVDPDKGLLKVVWIEEGTKDLESAQVHLRELGPWIVASMKDGEHSESIRYFWARVRWENGQIVVWAPNAKNFKQLVEEGKLPGVVTEGGDVILGDLKPEHYTLITSGAEGVLFEWDEPGVLLRIGQ